MGDDDYRTCQTCRYLETADHYEPCVGCCSNDLWKPNVKLYEFLERFIAEEASEYD
jgi:hypothetical protein